MKITIITLAVLIFFVSCKEKKDSNKDFQKENITYLSYGKKITAENAVSKEGMAKKFEDLKKGDTIDMKFASNINEVCKTKGCWMKLDLGSDSEAMVRFTDYGFFVPLNSDKRDVIIEGRAFVSEISVEELQHYAKDAGKSEEEIAQITEPKTSFGFEADGVLMVQ
jgi:hypothetical protein